MVFGRSELSEELHDYMDIRMRRAVVNFNCVQAVVCAYKRLIVPRPYPMADARVSAENDASNGGCGESAKSECGYASAKADFSYCSGEIFGRNICMRPDEVSTGIFFVSFLER